MDTNLNFKLSLDGKKSFSHLCIIFACTSLPLFKLFLGIIRNLLLNIHAINMNIGNRSQSHECEFYGNYNILFSGFGIYTPAIACHTLLLHLPRLLDSCKPNSLFVMYAMKNPTSAAPPATSILLIKFWSCNFKRYHPLPTKVWWSSWFVADYPSPFLVLPEIRRYKYLAIEIITIEQLLLDSGTNSFMKKETSSASTLKKYSDIRSSKNKLL